MQPAVFNHIVQEMHDRDDARRLANDENARSPHPFPFSFFYQLFFIFAIASSTR